MPRLLFLLAIAAVVYLLLNRIQGMPPHRRRSEYLKLVGGAAVFAVLLLTLAGKMHWVGAAFTGLLVALRQTLPLLIRLFPLIGRLGSASSQASAPHHSTVSTATLRMRMDHETGALSGDVLAGPLQDWRLDELSRDQLQQLMNYCGAQDPESVALLEGYLEQRFGEEDSAFSDDEAPRGAAGREGMSRQEALDVLGLRDGADRDAITAAHRKLMQKLHPDRGGSDWLAAKINQAKDLLLAQQAPP